MALRETMTVTMKMPQAQQLCGHASSVTLCVPTYKRPHLLETLLRDASAQTLRPATVIVVDGDAASGDVRAMLHRIRAVASWRVIYVPSNHANLAYQRYLGYLAARGTDVLIYLDDDLRVSDTSMFEKLLKPFMNGDSGFVAGTATIRFPELGQAIGAIRDRILDTQVTPGCLVRWLGGSRSIEPGGLTPMGHRIPPDASGAEYSCVGWLRGGVMAFRMSILSEEFFSDDLFALTWARCGLGEDTFLGRRALSLGKVFVAHEAVVDHPNADAPKAYPVQAFRLAFATAYSRRFINDTYRGFALPTLGDRLSLAKGLLGGSALALWRLLRSPSRRRAAYAAGYVGGCLKAAFVPPRARRLTPRIDWRSDARKSIDAMETL
jgi:glycosyltransferase involved in cell wall biosynthesis